MNITLVKLKGVVEALLVIAEQLTRIADSMEMDLAYKGIHLTPPKADVSGEAPELAYTDEEEDFLREYEEAMGVSKNAEDDEDERPVGLT
jgi:hypothetical protein